MANYSMQPNDVIVRIFHRDGTLYKELDIWKGKQDDEMPTLLS
jgi:hypothetical protein